MWIRSLYFSAVASNHWAVHTTSVVLLPARYACCPSERNSLTALVIRFNTIVDSTLRRTTKNISGLVISAVLNFPGLSGLFNGNKYPVVSSGRGSCLSNISLHIFAPSSHALTPAYLICSPAIRSGPSARLLPSFTAPTPNSAAVI